MTTSPTPITSSARHLPGLYTLFFTEMWERCSYYGMRGLLVLFMKATLEKGGLEFSIPMAGAIYGLYAAAGVWVALSKRRRDLSLGLKFAVGLLLLGVGYVLIAVGAQRAVAGPVEPVWLLFTYLLHTMGELRVSPVGLSSITRLAPARIVGQAMGLWFMATAPGNLMAGLIAGESTSPSQMSSQFWWVALSAAGIAILIMFLARPMRRSMASIN